MEHQTRREFVKLACLGTAAGSFTGAGLSLAQAGTAEDSKPLKSNIRLGLASYTFKEFDLDETLSMTQRLGLKYIVFKSFHLPLDSSPDTIRSVVDKVHKAGLELYGGGVIYMSTEKEVQQAFEYARTAGMEVIIGVPHPDLLKLVEQKVQETDIKVAIHNHGPGDALYPTPGSAYEKIKDLDKRMGLCIDIGHTQRAGVNPSDAARKYADRLLDIHIKDVSAARAEGQTVEIGRGVIDIPLFLRTLLDIKYKGVASFEYEKDPKDPLAGLAESVGYVRGVLAAFQ
ncbi:MAG: sugar phosphate isomerase/epimerase [Sedimentisphaerales bacterium]|nr:sugar phosphate isomerase/epimerase [Sedimentisphaerales bacterium]